MSDNPSLLELYSAWDTLNQAAQRIITAQPHQMTESAEKLEMARENIRKAIWNLKP